MNHPQPTNQPRKGRIAIFVIIFLVIYFLMLVVVAKFLLYNNPPPPPDTPTDPPVGDGAVGAEVFTWLDLNGDGHKSEDEPPLSNVAATIVEDNTYPSPEVFKRIHTGPFEGEAITDQNGLTHLYIFMAGGCPKDCLYGYSVAVEAVRKN